MAVSIDKNNLDKSWFEPVYKHDLYEWNGDAFMITATFPENSSR